MVKFSTRNGNPIDKEVGRTLCRAEIAMFKIVRFPPKLESFFVSLSSGFHWDHFEYFRLLVLLIVFAWGRRNISGLYRHLDDRQRPHRTRFNNFVQLSRWDPEKALQGKALELLAVLKPQPGEVVEFILDDSKKAKRGKEMEGVNWIHDPLSGKKIRGHQYVMAVLRFRGHTIPFGVRLYVKKEDGRRLQIRFRKTTELAAELIQALAPPPGVGVRVLFDSFYLCPVVVKACRQKGFHFVSTLKSNRNLYKHGRKLKAGSYGGHLFRRGRRKKLTLGKNKGAVVYTHVDAGWLEVSDLGRLHVVFSRKNREPKILGLATDDPRLSASQIITAYDDRWSIEVYFKDGKQLLGLGQYQNGTYHAAVIHLHLVCFAYALLTHIAITREGAQGQRKTAAHLSTADLQNEVRRIVWEDLAQHLKQFSCGTQIVKELERLLIAA
jgi:SRSO17 transposase